MRRVFSLSLLCLTASLSLASPTTPPPSAPAPACVLPAGPLPTQTRAVFLLDTSGSMRGIGDGQANIFERVKVSINNYVRAEQPDRVDLVTFDSGVRTQRGYDFPAAAGRFNGDLAALRADGRNTYLYQSLQAALKPLSGANRYLTRVFVLTDGIDNDTSRSATAQGALAAFKGRGTLDTLHYVALGATIPADAARALAASSYADTQTVPVGEVPDLTRVATGDGLRTVTDAGKVAAPYLDGTPLALASAASGVQLAQPTAQGGLVRLNVPPRLPHGTVVLLCAPSSRAEAPARRVLLRLNIGTDPALAWLNPAADLTLKAGETVNLRYRAAIGLNLDGARVGGVAGTGLEGVLEQQPGSREFTVRVTNAGLKPGRTLTPTLALADGRRLALPPIAGDEGGRVLPAAGSVGTGPSVPPTLPVTPENSGGPARFAAWVLGGAALLGLLFFLWRRRQARRLAPAARVSVPPPAVEGIEYREDRTLALVTANGDVSSVNMPLGGAFDLGQLASVPHLSGLRAEQHRDGLSIINVPVDLEVSQGARLLQSGDVVRPGTLLGVAVARLSRAPHPPLGSLVGLGLPLRLLADGVTLHVTGPYGDHAFTLGAGITDLGEAFQAPALVGVRVSSSGPRVLLADVPSHLILSRFGEPAPLRPGTYLPPASELTFLND
ncbi:VWA domain-containing protein [Deinococcus sp. Arct2-2]|uniref:vWA domain-containing protein n=1 Tax=Deinococcus sp. Arct2-2 TaxID=2568653 RepID=UPI0010A4C39E|nr:vWA domain-containing protein [Deinococcus sp. Arct2-2]THF68249.1 VWA domain-containing protein [Deinococcus sp. Arct2-2]